MLAKLRILARLLLSLLRFLAILLAMTIGALIMLAIFIDELPLKAPPEHLLHPSGGPYLDAHVHIAGIGEGQSGCFVSDELKKSYKYPFYLSALDVSEAEIKAHGDQLVVKRLSEKIAKSRLVEFAVVLAMDGVVGSDGDLDVEKTEVYVPNSFVEKEISKYPNLLYGASINPYRKDAIERLIEAKRHGAVLVKWIPAVMEIDPADKRLTPFYKTLVELEMPLLTHAGQERTFSKARDEFGDPLKLQLPLSLGVTVIAAHVATTGSSEGQDNFERILPLFERYPNLFADISSLTQINKLGYLKKALNSDQLRGRLIYGSDWPLQFPLLVSPWYQFLTLTPGEMRYLSKIDNLFDRDVLLKKALGVSEDVFSRSDELLLSSFKATRPHRAEAPLPVVSTSPEVKPVAAPVSTPAPTSVTIDGHQAKQVKLPAGRDMN